MATGFHGLRDRRASPSCSSSPAPSRPAHTRQRHRRRRDLLLWTSSTSCGSRSSRRSTSCADGSPDDRPAQPRRTPGPLPRPFDRPPDHLGRQDRTVNALAARRRHPAAIAVLLLLGLLVTGGAYSFFAPKDANAAPTVSADAVRTARTSSSPTARAATGSMPRARSPAPASWASAPRRSTSRSAPAVCRSPGPTSRLPSTR